MASKNGAVLIAEAPSVTTVGGLLQACATVLRHVCDDPAREARDIMAAILDVPRFWPTANVELGVSREHERAVLAAARKRSTGMPLAYAVGRASFRHLTLSVDERVLIPRVETELLVDLVLERFTSKTRTAADIGTGSGAIAIALAFERKFERVFATDVSLDALEVAALNAKSLAPVLQSPVEFRRGSLLAPLVGERLGAIISNPPYVSFSELNELPHEVRDWEPVAALLSSQDGLSLTRGIVREAPTLLEPDGVLALEVDTRRAGTVAEMISVDGRYENVEVLLDLTGRERFVIARRSGWRDGARES